jgi:phage/plasmid-like protein (TIGR03299 family)
MAHQITERADGYAEMAFVGQTPWHGLGQELDQNADIDSWKKAAGMDWTIESAPVQFFGAGDNQNLHTFEGQRILHRSDTKAPLSVVSTRYKPVQPSEVLEFFRDLVEENGFKLHTAGTLFGGRRMWALAETGKFAEVSKGDGIGGFLLLSTSADKSLATTARFTTIRVVCNNTLSAATAGENATAVSFTHSREFDHELMRERLGAAVNSFGAFMDAAKFMQAQKLSYERASAIIKKLVVPAYAETKENYDPENNRIYKSIIKLFDGGAKGYELTGMTNWGLMNAVTEYYDHHTPARTDDARLNNTWFANGQAIKQQAFDMLTT